MWMRLQTSTVRRWWKEEYDPKELPQLILGSFLFVVAVDMKTGRAIGMGRVISDGVSDGYIQDLVVLPEYRKTGIGSRIVSVLVKKCVEEEFPGLVLLQNRNRKFLSALRFLPWWGILR